MDPKKGFSLIDGLFARQDVVRLLNPPSPFPRDGVEVLFQVRFFRTKQHPAGNSSGTSELWNSWTVSQADSVCRCECMLGSEFVKLNCVKTYACATHSESGGRVYNPSEEES